MSTYDWRTVPPTPSDVDVDGRIQVPKSLPIHKGSAGKTIAVSEYAAGTVWRPTKRRKTSSEPLIDMLQSAQQPPSSLTQSLKSLGNKGALQPLGVKVSAFDRARLDRYAEELGLTQSSLVRHLISNGLNQLDAEAGPA